MSSKSPLRIPKPDQETEEENRIVRGEGLVGGEGGGGGEVKS